MFSPAINNVFTKKELMDNLESYSNLINAETLRNYTLNDDENIYPFPSDTHNVSVATLQPTYTYYLGFANYECKSTILNLIREEFLYTSGPPYDVDQKADELKLKLQNEEYEDFILALEPALGRPLEPEIRYHVLIASIFEGYDVQGFIQKIEVKPKEGTGKAIDYVLEMIDMDIVFGIKFESNEEDALNKCESKYIRDYIASRKKKAACIGLKFISKERKNKTLPISIKWGIVLHNEKGDPIGQPHENGLETKKLKRNEY